MGTWKSSVLSLHARAFAGDFCFAIVCDHHFFYFKYCLLPSRKLWLGLWVFISVLLGCGGLAIRRDRMLLLQNPLVIAFWFQIVPEALCDIPLYTQVSIMRAKVFDMLQEICSLKYFIMLGWNNLKFLRKFELLWRDLKDSFHHFSYWTIATL